jgi:hypothetical protein
MNGFDLEFVYHRNLICFLYVALTFVVGFQRILPFLPLSVKSKVEKW